MEIKKTPPAVLAEGVKYNTVPPLFTENLAIIRLTKYKDFLFCNGNVRQRLLLLRAAAQKGIR